MVDLMKLPDALRRILLDRKGAAMVEYALLAGLVAIVAMATLGTLGNGVKNQFSSISTKL